MRTFIAVSELDKCCVHSLVHLDVIFDHSHRGVKKLAIMLWSLTQLVT